VRIIKPGKVEPIKYQATCLNCGAIIEATKDELNIKFCPRGQYSFAHERCLECESSVVFYKK